MKRIELFFERAFPWKPNTMSFLGFWTMKDFGFIECGFGLVFVNIGVRIGRAG